MISRSHEVRTWPVADVLGVPTSRLVEEAHS